MLTLPSFKEATPNLQGSRFCSFGLTALRVDDKAHRWKQNIPSSIPSKWNPSATRFCLCWSKDTDGMRPRPERNLDVTFWSWFRVKETADVHSSAPGLQLLWGTPRREAPSLQSPCPHAPCGFIYTCFHSSFLKVTAASVWQPVTKDYRFSYGRQVRCHHKAKPVPMSCLWCVAEVTFYPGCAIAVIQIYFFPRLNMSWLSLLCVYIGVNERCACVYVCVCVQTTCQFKWKLTHM